MYCTDTNHLGSSFHRNSSVLLPVLSRSSVTFLDAALPEQYCSRKRGLLSRNDLAIIGTDVLVRMLSTVFSANVKHDGRSSLNQKLARHLGVAAKHSYTHESEGLIGILQVC